MDEVTLQNPRPEAGMRVETQVNYWIMLTNTPKVFAISPLGGLSRDKLLTFGVFPGQ